MGSDLEAAVWALEEAVEEVISFLRAASYGLRLATKRLGDLTAGAASSSGSGIQSTADVDRLIRALERGEDGLSDVVILALGDHFRAFLGRALQLPQLPPLPGTPAEIETMAGTPGALEGVHFWFALLLQLYRAVLRGGRIDREALERLGLIDLEIPFPGGKVKLFRLGTHVTLSERHLGETAEAVLTAARAIRLRLTTA